MASTYSNLKIQLMTTGENSGTWGNVTNVNLGTAIEEAIVGTSDVTFSSADVTLTLTNSNTTQDARKLRLNLIGVSGGARQLIVPAIEKIYIVNNGLADAVTVKNTTGTGITVAAGKTMYVYNNGTNVVDAITHLTSLTLATPLATPSGGTGLNASGTAGNVLTSDGTVWTSQAVDAFVTGMILMWSGTIATIPSGWALCDGGSGTPDLRNRFIIGADADDGGAAKTNVTGTYTQSGGSKDAIVVSHTHTATVTDPGHSHAQTYRNDLGAGGRDALWVSGTATASTASATTGISVGISTEGSSGTNANLPPYFALAYIMKL